MYKIIKDMTWPAPGERMDELERQMRYGDPGISDRLLAASVIAAYRQMVTDPQVKRNMVVSELKNCTKKTKVKK